MNYEDTLEYNAKLLEENTALNNRVKELEGNLAGAIRDCDDARVDASYFRKLKGLKQPISYRTQTVDNPGVVELWGISGIESCDLETAIDAAVKASQ